MILRYSRTHQVMLNDPAKVKGEHKNQCHVLSRPRAQPTCIFFSQKMELYFGRSVACACMSNDNNNKVNRVYLHLRPMISCPDIVHVFIPWIT